MHKNKIVHRDLKPENLIYVDESKDSLKLIDFGESRFLKEHETVNEFSGSVFN